MAQEYFTSLADIRSKSKRNFGRPERAPYLSHGELLNRALKQPVQSSQSTVTSFSDWVLSLYTPANDEAAMERGKRWEIMFVDGVEKVVDVVKERADRIEALRREKLVRSASSWFKYDEWKLQFNGMTDSGVKPLAASRLLINDHPLMGKPDLVFQHWHTKDILILELKTWKGYGRLPPFGWPNVKAQLWCYGLMDEWRSAPNVYLQARVWRWIDPRDWRRPPEVDAGVQYPGFISEPWRSDDPRVHKECLELFEAFGGRYLAS
jgi:hypothetical protein